MLDNTLCRFGYDLGLCLNQITFIVLLLPSVFSLVSFEICLQTGSVFSGLVPHFLERNLKEQDTVVVLLHEVTELRIFLLEVLVHVRLHIGVTHLCRQVILGTCLADKTLVCLFGALVALYLTQNLRTHRIQRLNTALVLFV